jgi:manganese oxidase
MTHHTMNQMGHAFPNMVGADAARMKRAIKPLIPDFMAMGRTGMGEMGKMQTGMGHMSNTHTGSMVTPENSIAMMGRDGPYGVIDMGGMFTVLKVREKLASYADPGWYQPPAGTVAQKASWQDLERDGVKV